MNSSVSSARKTWSAHTEVLKKRSFAIAGHRTSIALEPEFWTELESEAAAVGISLAALVARIDQNRQGRNLASALRVHVLVNLSSPVYGEGDRREAAVEGA